MKCRICKGNMYIDEWGGWHWACPTCYINGRKATDKEIEDQQREVEEWLKKEK